MHIQAQRSVAALISAYILGLLSGCGTGVPSNLSADAKAAFVGGSCPDEIDWLATDVDGKFEHILEFAQQHLGDRVGRGECWDLADQALATLPAVMLHRGQGPGVEYKWGRLSATITPHYRTGRLHPGMILQFRDALFSWRRGRMVYRRLADHHTAIVSAVSRDRRDVCILHQNSSGVRQVKYGYYRMSSIQKGTVRAYTPLKRTVE